MDLSRANLVSSFIGGKGQGSGCCFGVANEVPDADKEICEYYHRVDVKNTPSQISLTENHVNATLSESYPLVDSQTDVYTCNQECKVSNYLISYFVVFL